MRTYLQCNIYVYKIQIISRVKKNVIDVVSGYGSERRTLNQCSIVAKKFCFHIYKSDNQHTVVPSEYCVFMLT